MRKRKELQIGVRISEELKKDLDRLAALRDVPVAWIVREALRQAVAVGVLR